MVEVTLALGVIGICLLAVVGLLPTGLQSQQDAREESNATSALKMVATAAQSLQFTGRSGGAPSWIFPSYFYDASGNSISLSVGQTPKQYTFFVGDGGLIIANGDTTTTRRQTLYVKVYSPSVEGRPVRIYAALAWPHKPTDDDGATPNEMTDREGFLDSFVAFTPQSSF